MKIKDLDLKSVKNEYRPMPFWSRNEKLDTEETARQVRMMHTAGIGGFFMHARGGLGTEHMGEDWFDNISAAKDEGKRLNMRAWAYDENGWPSGFGDGKVNGKEKTILTDNKIPLSDCECGRQKIKLTLINNLRNLLGPHHLKEGECYNVCPSSFYKENCIWNERAEDTWNDDYCFVEFGLQKKGELL